MMTHRLTVLVRAADADLASGAFYAADITTFLTQEPGDLGTEDEPVPEGDVRFVAFLDVADGLEARVAVVQALVGGRADVALAPFEDQDWLQKFRAHHRAVRVGRGLIVAPPWSKLKVRKKGPLVIRIDPGLAFGTGSHASTYLCLRALCDRARRGPLGRVLDIGTGSGVLAFAALRLGANSARGIEPDPDALQAAGENAALNHIGKAQGLTLTGETADVVRGRYDLVLANLVRDLLIDTAGDITARVGPKGALVLAGILDDQVHDVTAAFVAEGLSLARQRRRQGWSALELSR